MLEYWVLSSSDDYEKCWTNKYIFIYSYIRVVADIHVGCRWTDGAEGQEESQKGPRFILYVQNRLTSQQQSWFYYMNKKVDIFEMHVVMIIKNLIVISDKHHIK